MTLKTCAKCGAAKLLEEFSTYRKRDRPRLHYRRSACKACCRAERRAYYQEHREQEDARTRAWSREKYRTDPEYAAMVRARVARHRRGTEVPADSAPHGLVDAGPVLAAVDRSGVPHAVISARAGWEHSTAGKAIQRAEASGQMQAGTAVRLLTAIDVLPVEVDL